VGDEDKPAGDRSDPIAPVALLPPPPHPATTPIKSTEALADNILGDIGYLLRHGRRNRITASERLLSLMTNLVRRVLQIGTGSDAAITKTGLKIYSNVKTIQALAVEIVNLFSRKLTIMRAQIRFEQPSNKLNN
jgi:hypothetical protein